MLAAPDVLVTLGTAALLPMKKATTTIPTIFTVVSDPVAQGFVASLAHPGGNMTGFSNYEPDVGRRWLQLLKEVAPSATQIAVLFNPITSPYNALWMRSIEAAAPGFSDLSKAMRISIALLIRCGRSLEPALLFRRIHLRLSAQL